MTDLIDAIELLLQDHRLIGGLAEELDCTDDPAEIGRLYLRMVDELSAHEAAEQDVVFPAFRAALERSGDHTVADRMGEHEEMNELLVTTSTRHRPITAGSPTKADRARAGLGAPPPGSGLPAS
jgi:hemerythrin superfamily protein